MTLNLGTAPNDIGYRKTNSLRGAPRRGFADYSTIWKEGFKRRVFLDGSSVSGANRRQWYLPRQFGGYVGVTLVNVCGLARQREF